MSTRTLVWTLAAVALALVVLPFVGMLTLHGGVIHSGSMHDGMMGGGTPAMYIGGLVWLLLTVAVIVGLVAVLLRGETKT